MAEPLIRKQLIGIAGSAAAMATLVLLWRCRSLLPHSQPREDDPQSRLAFALTWLLLPGIALLIGIVGASRRGFHEDAIDGTRTPVSPALEINLRYNQNTLEQVALAAIAWTGLALQLPHDQLFLLPIMATLFLVGRIAFFAGYLIYPIGRVYGMTLTVLPTIISYGWLVSRVIIDKIFL